MWTNHDLVWKGCVTGFHSIGYGYLFAWKDAIQQICSEECSKVIFTGVISHLCDNVGSRFTTIVQQICSEECYIKILTPPGAINHLQVCDNMGFRFNTKGGKEFMVFCTMRLGVHIGPTTMKKTVAFFWFHPLESMCVPMLVTKDGKFWQQ
jgi:hypothetical protein